MMRMMPCIAGCAGPTLRSISRVSSFGCSILVVRSYQWLALLDRVVFPQRMPFESVVHQDPLQVRMSAEADPEHVPHLALEPVGASPEGSERVDFRVLLVYRNLDAQPVLERERKEGVDDDEAPGRRWSRPGVLVGNRSRRAHRDSRRSEERRRRLRAERGEVHGGEVHQEIHLEGGIFLERPRELEERLPADDHRGIAAKCVRGFDRPGEAILDGLNQGLRIHTVNSGLGSGADRSPVSCWFWILAWSFR